MNFEAWNTAAAVGTFVVIAASAIAALVQLRHLRTSNQLSGLVSVFEMLQDQGVRGLPRCRATIAADGRRRCKCLERIDR
jgi:hypothetical protein